MPPLLLNQPPVPGGARAPRALRARRGRRAPAPRRLRAAVRLSIGGSLGHDRDRPHLRGPRSSPARSTPRAFGRPHGGLEARVVDDADRGGRRAAPRASCSCAGAAPRARATASSRATSRTRGRPRRPGAAAGSTPATSCAGCDDGMLVFVDRKKNIIRALRRERRRRRGGGGAAGARGGGAGRGAGRARRAARGGSHGLRGADAGRRAATRALAERLMDWCLDAARLLQGAGLDPLRRRAPDHRHPEGAEGPDLPARRGSAPTPRRSRSARAQEAEPQPGRSSADRSSSVEAHRQIVGRLPGEAGRPLCPGYPDLPRPEPARAATSTWSSGDREHEGAETVLSASRRDRRPPRPDASTIARDPRCAAPHQRRLAVTIEGVDIGAGAQQSAAPSRRRLGSPRRSPGLVHGAGLPAPVPPRLVGGQEPGHLLIAELLRPSRAANRIRRSGCGGADPRPPRAGNSTAGKFRSPTAMCNGV